MHFCNIEEDLIVHEYYNFYVIRDTFPVTPLPFTHHYKKACCTLFHYSQEEHDEIPILLDTLKIEFKILDESITGFNIGMNIGKDAGQTIFHCHIHIIPRRQGDTQNPKGGVRGVIPLKQKY